MFVKLFHESWLSLHAHILSEEVPVISGVLSAKLVWGLLVVVGHEMAEDPWSHVCVIWARSNSWEHHGSSLLVALSSHEPAWEDDHRKVGEEQEPTLFARLDLERMEMHVELWTDV